MRTFLLLLCERCVTNVVKPLTAAAAVTGGKGVAAVPRTQTHPCQPTMDYSFIQNCHFHEMFLHLGLDLDRTWDRISIELRMRKITLWAIEAGMGLGSISGSNVWLQAVICCDLPLLVYIYFSIYIYFHIYIFSSFFLVHPIPSSAPSPPLLNGRLRSLEIGHFGLDGRQHHHHHSSDPSETCWVVRR